MYIFQNRQWDSYEDQVTRLFSHNHLSLHTFFCILLHFMVIDQITCRLDSGNFYLLGRSLHAVHGREMNTGKDLGPDHNIKINKCKIGKVNSSMGMLSKETGFWGDWHGNKWSHKTILWNFAPTNFEASSTIHTSVWRCITDWWPWDLSLTSLTITLYHVNNTEYCWRFLQGHHRHLKHKNEL